MPVAEADPADAGGETLKANALARHVEPIVQMLVVRHQFFDLGVGLIDVFGIAGERSPAKWADATTKQRADVGRHETGKLEGVGDALLLRHLTDVVAIVERRHARAVEIEHRAHMRGHRSARGLVNRFGVALAPLLPLRQRPTLRQISVDGIMRRGLIGDGVGPDATTKQFGKHICGVAEQPHGNRLALRLRVFEHRQRLFDRRRLRVQISGAKPHFDTAWLTLDGQTGEARHGRCERLRAAHSAQTRGEDPAACEIAVVVLAPHLDEGFVGALHDALRADVDPRARRHLAVHHQALAIEFMKVLPGRPMGDQIGIGDQHTGRVGVGLENAGGLAGLHEQRLIALQTPERRSDLVEGVPIAGGAADAAVDHQFAGPFGDIRVEIVHQHAQRRFRQPRFCGQFRAVRGANYAGVVDAGVGRHFRPLRNGAPSRARLGEGFAA